MSNPSPFPYPSEDLPADGREAAVDEVLLAEEPKPPPQPSAPPPPSRTRWLLPLCLFLLTCGSTYLVGGPVYALAVMTILGCHEAGHFLQAKRYGVRASLPFFIPVPVPPIGTLGAVIAMSSNITNRRALFDIGISGPLAGLVPTFIFLVIGIQTSTVAPSAGGGFEFGDPLLVQWLSQLKHGPIPEGYSVYIGPTAMAAWVGLLITSLNLFPIGQLDGGHVLYALLRRRAYPVARGVLLGVIVAVALFGYYWWFLMILLVLLMGPKHPPTADDRVRLGPVRVVLGWLTLAFLPLGFAPNPFPSELQARGLLHLIFH